MASKPRGTDKKGKPLSSYWKAKLELEEATARIAELEAENAQLKAGGASAAPAPAPATSAPAAPSAAASGDNEALLDQIRALKQQAVERKSTHEEMVAKFQKDLAGLKETVRDAEKDRDRAKDEVKRLESKVEALESVGSDGESSGAVTKVEGFPTVRQLLSWFGLSLHPRIIATGHTGSARLDIEIREKDVARVITLDSGTSRVYDVVGLDAPADQLLTVFLPYRRYFELQTEARVIDVCRLLGRPLALDRVGRAR